MATVGEVEGIGPAYAEKLAAAGVETTDDVLTAGASASGCDKLAEATGVTGKLILEWINHGDPLPPKGVGSVVADLLEAAGVDSPGELAHCDAANLATTIGEVTAGRPSIVRP